MAVAHPQPKVATRCPHSHRHQRQACCHPAPGTKMAACRPTLLPRHEAASTRLGGLGKLAAAMPRQCSRLTMVVAAALVLVLHLVVL